MKYLYLILLGFLAFATATLAEGNGNINKTPVIQADNITVTGNIVDEEGEPLTGATVQQTGTTNGTITDIDGNFSLSVPADATLKISFIGFQNTEINVDGNTNLGTITCTSDLHELDQVVVVGYGTQRKVDLTGSVSVVDTEEMKKTSKSNISTMLQGKVAGVRITSDGQPGADPTVRIRGVGSFGNTSPLYVVDGVPMGTTIRDFSPNDIESLQVLKDASAAAIYGSRAANGVIIITTKQGEKDQPLKIDYSGYMGFDQVEKGVYDVMDSQQYGEYVTMAYNNFNNMDVPAGYDPESAKYIDPNEVNTDWHDEAFKVGVRQNHNINLSGGGSNNTYNVSLDYFSQEGTMEGLGPNFDRYTARANNTMSVKFLEINTSIVYSHSNQDNMALSNANEYVQGLYGAQYPVMASVLLTPPTIKAYDESTWVLDDKISAASQYKYDSYGYGTYYDDVHGDLRVTNVLLTNSLLERNSIVDRFVGSGSAKVDLIDMIGEESNNHKLNYNLNVSYNKTTVKDRTFVPAFIQSTTNYLSKDNERLTQEYRSYSSSLIENFINYDGKIGRHNINTMAGQTYEYAYHHRLTGEGVTLSEPYYLQINNAEEKSAETYEEESVLASYIGRVNYNFDSKYLISLTGRYDGSSRLSVDRWDFFPSVSAGWRIERENFFPVDESLISLLKVRGSYGELGSINTLGPYEYMDNMLRGDYTYSFGNNKVTGSAVSNYVNEILRWEKKKTLDVGLDLAMFNNKFEFTFDWYESTSEDLHYGVVIPLSAGVTNETVNMNRATMVNSGLEFLASYRNRQHAVKYEVSANLSTLNNEVTQLGFSGEPQTDGNHRTEVGREVGEFYGLAYDGIFQSQGEIDNNLNSEGASVTQDGAKPGDVRYKDINNDGEITLEGDRKFLGSGLPDINFGLNARVEWKGLDLSISTFGAAGYNVVDFVDMTLHGSYRSLNKSVDLLNAWTPGSESTVPRVAYNVEGDITNDLFSDRFIQDATYLKLSNITLGYNFPDVWFGGYISNVRVYATGQNLATFTNYNGYNVDFAAGTFTPGYNYASYPTPRSVMFGVNMTF
jgi:TonB-linked SusC/RagA family outer membrane protein